MSEWKDIASMPEGVACMTKIDDDKGCRNVEVLTKRTRVPGKTVPMFWADDFYVYYTPTHWKPL